MGKKFSELERAVSLNNGDLAAFAQVDQSAATGYKSKAAPMSLVSQKILKDTEYASDLQTDDKTVLGAINEVNSRTIAYDVASGPIANFKTSLELPIKSLGIDVNAVQAAGTPTPASPLPISGWSSIKLTKCGRNMVDIRPFNEWTAVRTSYYVLRSCLPNTIINASLIDKDTSVNMSDINFGFVDSAWDGTEQLTTLEYRWIIQNGVAQTTKRNVSTGDASKILTGLIFYPQTEETYNKVMARYNIEIELETVSTYEPYNGTTEVINLGGTYYGGHLTQDKDGHRQFVVTHAILEKAVADMNNSDDYPGWRNSGARNIVGAEVSSYFTGILNVGNGYSINTRGSNDIVYLPTGSYSMTQSQWIASYPDLIVQLLLPYAEPIIIDLPDGDPIITLNGMNSIYADSGDASVEYALTIEEYIDKKIASVQALILNS